MTKNLTFVEFYGKYSIFSLNSEFLSQPIYTVYFEYLDYASDRTVTVPIKISKYNYISIEKAKEFIDEKLDSKNEYAI